jgi:8-oxo-dGTP diphosphatase
MELWDILDGEGNKAGRTIVRGEKLQEGQYHLVVHIWILNDKGEFLIQKRAEHLKLLPGLWAATGGSAIAGEDGRIAAIREAKEELGIEVDTDNMTKLRVIKRKDNFAEVWLIKQNISIEDVVLQVEEVSAAKWIGKEELENMIKAGEFHNYGEDYFRNIFRVMRKCLSCEIVKGTTGTIGGTILETKYFHAHQDFAYPMPGLVILASKRHIYSIEEMSDEEASEYIHVLRKIRVAQRKVLGIDQVYYFYNEDTTHHFHTWMIPRYEWMNEFGRSVESVRPVLLHSKENMKDEKGTEEVKAAAARLYKELNLRKE